MRNRWTEPELVELEECYDNRIAHELNIPHHLIDRHGKWGCYIKASKMGYATTYTPVRLGLENWQDTEIAYLAGIIDGEGCIHDGTKNSLGSWCITITTTDVPLFDWLKKLDRGGSYRQRRGDREHHKQVYIFRATAVNDVLEILETVEPYLIIKKDKAQNGIEYLRAKLASKCH